MSSPLVWPRALALLLALTLIPLALLFLTCVVTWPGRLFALAIGLIGIGAILWAIGHERESDVQSRLGKSMLFLSLIIIALVGLHAPDGHTDESARMHTRYAGGTWKYDRHSIGSYLPEIDQIHLGFAAALALDPLLTRKQTQELSSLTDAIYEDMDRDPEFHASGSALPQIYQELTLSRFSDGHYFHYIPSQVDRSQPSPALVFLHGSGGNFKAYTWLLSTVADELGCTVIAPTFGLGNWEKKGTYDAITAAIEDAGTYAAIDPDQIHLMGLSNGGKGVSLAATKKNIRFRSLILLSALIHTSEAPFEIAKKWSDLPVLILSGDSDDRIPWDYVSHYALKMETEGLPVTLRSFRGQDHFLFFRQPRVIQEEVAHWLQTQKGG